MKDIMSGVAAKTLDLLFLESLPIRKILAEGSSIEYYCSVTCFLDCGQVCCLTWSVSRIRWDLLACTVMLGGSTYTFVVLLF
ncbi:hypothetical protein NC651_012894 [Populus alba x Populus x berolinensis]|nr:hypothetical protein NC651_012894 [Populus alba x Populus x berolinensis]